jgi:hypothetical protein
MKQPKKGIPCVTGVDELHYGFLIKEKLSVIEEITNSAEFHLFTKPTFKSRRNFPQIGEVVKKDEVIQSTAILHSFFISKGIKCSNPCFKTWEDWAKLVDTELCNQ